MDFDRLLEPARSVGEFGGHCARKFCLVRVCCGL
jgi:hypothetical protein